MAFSVIQPQPVPICSFCGNRESDVNKLLRGVIPTAHICDACVYLCVGLLVEHYRLSSLAAKAAGGELMQAIEKFKGVTGS